MGITLAIFGTIAVLLIIAAAAMFSSCGTGIQTFSDRWQATQAERNAAATTSSVPPNGCQQFTKLDTAVLTASDATAFGGPNESPLPTSAALTAIDELTKQLSVATPFATGPMGNHMRAAAAELQAARKRVTELPSVGGFVGSTDPSLTSLRETVYGELSIAEQLLGRTCGGHLIPSGARVSFGKKFADFLTTTSSSTTTTTTDRRP